MNQVSGFLLVFLDTTNKHHHIDVTYYVYEICYESKPTAK
jgi:hypothetical protein